MLNVPQYLIIHHTGGTQADPLADTSHHTFEIVDAYHKSLGWEGFGYHYFIDKSGTLTTGREENYHGAHTKGYNLKSIGICLAGNFDQTMPTEAQEKALAFLLADICGRYNIPRENIVPHRNFANKTCYGRRLADDWAQKLVPEDTRKVQVLTKLKELETIINNLY